MLAVAKLGADAQIGGAPDSVPQRRRATGRSRSIVIELQGLRPFCHPRHSIGFGVIEFLLVCYIS